MPLYQTSVLKNYLKRQDKETVAKAFKKFSKYFHNTSIQQNIRESKEEQFQEGFLRELFVDILGYTLNPQPNYNLTTELKNEKGAKKADGAILLDGNALGVIELKSTKTKDLESIRQQAFDYKANQTGCVYVVTSNFEKLRFYINNAVEFEEFDLFTLTQNQFELLYLCLHKDNLLSNVPLKIKEASVREEEVITKKFYNDYSLFKRELFRDLVKLNMKNEVYRSEFNREDTERANKNIKHNLFKKSQKLIDRFLFIFFAEDRDLLPPNSTLKILEQWNKLKDLDAYAPLYDRFKLYFGYLDTGRKGTDKGAEIFAYNGGLFKPDPILDSLQISDELLFKHTEALSKYDFESQVDVNILGHIFENSLNEIESVNAEIEGVEFDKQKTKRKKDGVFYTPKYITKYIVDNTVGKLCAEKKAELKIIDEEYTKNRKGRTTAKLKELRDQLENYRNWLLQITICDAACGSGAFLNQALDFLIKEHHYIDELQTSLLGGGFVFPDIENTVLENNIFGVDLNEESVEIAKLSLWLRTAQPRRKLNDLSSNIKCGNSLIDDPKVAGSKAFKWENEFPQIFAKGGFDVVIGNPPYVQLQSMGKIAKELEKAGYKTYESTGDLYCLFYELGNIILKKKGLMGYITSNKWMRGNYGKSLRKYFSTETNPLILIDLGSGIFTSATVDSNIIITKKEKVTEHKLIAIDISKEKDFTDFSIYFQNPIILKNLNEGMWILSDASLVKIENKINKGKKLIDWNISINYGVKTGYNEAFIISKEKRDELIRKDPKSEEILKPILRGRDIRRYNYDFADLFLINTHNGYKANSAVDIDKYFTIKEFLNSHWDKIEKRSDKGRTPYNLRNCAYVDKFEKPKIIYPETTVRRSEFVYDDEGLYLDKTCFFISGEKLKYLNAILSSKLYEYYLENKLRLVGSNTIQYSKQYITEVPIIEITETSVYEEKVDLITSNYKIYRKLIKSFLKLLQTKFFIEKLSNKLQNWYELEFGDFLKELKKAKVQLSLSEEAEWMQYFNEQKQKAQSLKAEIDKTDKEIDKMVYELYELSEEEIKIVEES